MANFQSRKGNTYSFKQLRRTFREESASDPGRSPDEIISKVIDVLQIEGDEATLMEVRRIGRDELK